MVQCQFLARLFVNENAISDDCITELVPAHAQQSSAGCDLHAYISRVRVVSWFRGFVVFFRNKYRACTPFAIYTMHNIMPWHAFLGYIDTTGILLLTRTSKAVRLILQNTPPAEVAVRTGRDALPRDLVNILAMSQMMHFVAVDLDLSNWRRVSNAPIRVAGIFPYCPHLRKIRVKFCALPDNEIVAMAHALKCCTSLVRIQFENMDLGIDSGRALADALQHLPALETMHMTNGSFGTNLETPFQAIFQALAGRPRLHTLNLTDYRVMDTKIAALAAELSTFSALSTLFLAGNEMRCPRLAHAVGSAVGKMKKLDNLDLTDMRCHRDPFAAVLAPFLQGLASASMCQPGYCNLSMNPMGCDAMPALGDILCADTEKRIGHLCVRYNEIAGATLQVLVREVRGRGLIRLDTLDIENNDLGDTGAAALGCLVLQCPFLARLFANENAISDDGIAELVPGLAQCSKLCRLSLGLNEITCTGARVLAQALPSWFSLAELNLESNNIANDGARCLAAAAPECIALQWLSLSKNEISEDVAQELAETLPAGGFGVDEQFFFA